MGANHRPGPGWGAILYVVVCAVTLLAFMVAVHLLTYFTIPSVVGVFGAVLSVVGMGLSFLLVRKYGDRAYVYAAIGVVLYCAAIVVILFLISVPRISYAFVSGGTRSLGPLEVTDYLIDHPDERDLRQGMVATKLEFRFEPTYSGTKKLGQLAALVSGDGKKAPIEKLLWDKFDSDSQPMTLTLTLQEVIDLSGIQKDGTGRTNILDKGFIPFNQAGLEIRIVQSRRQERTYAKFKVPVLNAPWDQRSVLVDRGGRKFVDVAIENRGATGKFAVVFHVTQVTTPTPSDTNTIWSGNKHIGWWITPPEYQTIASGGFITRSVPLTESLNLPTLDVGRYLVEVMTIKQQPYIAFTYPLTTTWQTPFGFNRWWFSRAIATDLHVFNVPAQMTNALVLNVPAPITEPLVRKEIDRLRQEQHIDLGAPLRAAETITSPSGIVGYRQVFDQGEIILHSGKAFSIYGEVYWHYKQLVDEEKGWGVSGKPLLPVTGIVDVDNAGQMAEFEGPNANTPRVAFYASPRGSAAVWGEVLDKYKAEGGPSGWLGFPVADLRYFPHSEIQAFRNGYIVSYYPSAPGTEYDYSRPAIAIPYRGSQPTLVEISASQPWQDTGIWLRAGDQMTIETLGDLWTHSPAIPPYDANGAPVTSTVTALPLSSAVVGSLIGQVGAGSVFPVGRLATATTAGEGHLLLGMNDADYRDNEGFVTVEVYAPPHSVPLDTLKFDYKDSPLAAGHGWTLVDANEMAVTFTPVEDAYVGRAIRIRATEPYGMDYTVKDAVSQHTDTLEVVAALGNDGRIYVDIVLQGCGVSPGWLKLQAGGSIDQEPRRIDDNEWSIAVQPATDVGGAWRRYQIDLIDAVQRTFGQEGCSFGKLLGYRLRGGMDIQQIAAYDRQP